jgi:cytochrome c oxidase assembly factor CtaG
MTTRQFFLSAWNGNTIAIGLVLVAVVFFADRWRAQSGIHGRCLAAAIGLFFLTLASPLNALAVDDLFSAHMLQHLLLLLVVPLLLVLALPETREGDPDVRPSRFRLPPLVAWLAGLSAMWVWHVPVLCDAATRNSAVRSLQIASLLVLGALFWWPLFGPRRQRRLAPLTAVVYLFGACLGCSLLGILITFAPLGEVCSSYLAPPDSLGLLPLIRRDWGFTPKVDQQVGGLLMWVPGCGLYLGGVIVMLARWYRAAEDGAPFFAAATAGEEPAMARAAGEVNASCSLTLSSQSEAPLNVPTRLTKEKDKEVRERFSAQIK